LRSVRRKAKETIDLGRPLGKRGPRWATMVDSIASGALAADPTAEKQAEKKLGSVSAGSETTLGPGAIGGREPWAETKRDLLDRRRALLAAFNYTRHFGWVPYDRWTWCIAGSAGGPKPHGEAPRPVRNIIIRGSGIRRGLLGVRPVYLDFSLRANRLQGAESFLRRQHRIRGRSRSQTSRHPAQWSQKTCRCFFLGNVN